MSYENDSKRRRTGTPPGRNAIAMHFHNAPGEVPPQELRPSQMKAHERFQPNPLLTFDAPLPLGVTLVDALICQNVELFQSCAEDGPQSAQLGLRCVHCARAMQRHVDSCIVFPSCIETMANTVRMMSERHFPNCEVLPDSVRESFDDYRRVRRNSYGGNESSKLEVQALTSFLNGVCRKANVVNRHPVQTGIAVGNALEPLSLPSAYHEESSSTLQYSKPDTIPIRQPPSPHITRRDNAMMVPRTHSDQQYQQSWPPYRTHSSSGYKNMPFVQIGQNIWECQYCLNQPIGQRAERYAWYAPSPPDNSFVDGHLRYCTGREPYLHSRQSHQHQSTTARYYDYPSSPGMYNSMHPSNHIDHPGSSQPPTQMNYGSSYQHPRYSPNDPLFNQQYQTQHSPVPSQFDQNSSKSWYHSTPPVNAYNQHQLTPSSGPSYYHSQQRELSPRYQSGSFDAAIQPPKKESPDSNSSGRNSDLNEANEYLTKMEMASSTPESKNFLVKDGDKHLITDYFYHVMKQLHICHFKENDRTTRGGKRDNVLIGYGGLECIHCAGTPRPRKFFWSNVDRLSNSFSEIPGHLLKCKVCPESTKNALTELKKFHPTQMNEKSRGSQKTFLRRVWRRIHEGNIKEVEESAKSSDSLKTDILPIDSIVSLGSDSPDASGKLLQAAVTSCKSVEESAKILASDAGTSGTKTCILLAIDQDKHWGKLIQYLNSAFISIQCIRSLSPLIIYCHLLLEGLSDLDIFARQNLEVFCCSTESEALKYSHNGEVVYKGQVGLRCINCLQASDQEEAYVTFPSSLVDIFTTVRAYSSKHLRSCSYLTKEQQQKYDSLNASSSSSFGTIVREYYRNAAEALGLRDTLGRGIRATGHGGFRHAV